jgi:hypothetical protein
VYVLCRAGICLRVLLFDPKRHSVLGSVERSRHSVAQPTTPSEQRVRVIDIAIRCDAVVREGGDTVYAIEMS